MRNQCEIKIKVLLSVSAFVRFGAVDSHSITLVKMLCRQQNGVK